MECFGGSGFTVAGCTIRRKRSSISRRPRPESQTFPESSNLFPLSLTPPLNRSEGETAPKRSRKDNGGFGDINSFERNDHLKNGSDFKVGNDGAHLGRGRNGDNWNSRESTVVSDGIGSENKLKKVKLKLGGVTRTIHTNAASEFAFSDGSFATKTSRSSDARQPHLKLSFQDNIDSSQSSALDKGKGLQGVPWKDFSRSVSVNGTHKSEPVRKSKRVPKRRMLDVGFNDDDEDEEIRYLGKLNASKVAGDHQGEDKDDIGAYNSPRLGKDGKKKSRSGKVYEDRDYMEDEELTSDDEPEAKRKRPRKESLDSLVEGRKEMTFTTRRQALLFGKDTFSGSDAGLVELPNGLPPASSKKQKEKLSEVEQQLKKAEAAQRRRIQSEKAAREAEAGAIRKILGQDSARKKREEKKKLRDELAQGRAANAVALASNTIRWTMGPTGTTVTFSEDIGLPNIFNHVPSSYPPPREKCVGPNCTNAYKYRDSKSNLPLCSLRCYKAIHEQVWPLLAC
ncbi:uncharacterized protein LOC117913847 [Vitis riparia]|uniref:uncharacterized protein LOC117913847 n=1 Tax=Vitis riparia TaxID=96939 RepID=UPI00155B3096|nr:uncharacterized protein LOC117913847 [Vitis riparia]